MSEGRLFFPLWAVRGRGQDIPIATTYNAGHLFIGIGNHRFKGQTGLQLDQVKDIANYPAYFLVFIHHAERGVIGINHYAQFAVFFQPASFLGGKSQVPG
ncbi:hypothetical protein D3C75_1121610 [compost metagenome]